MYENKVEKASFLYLTKFIFYRKMSREYEVKSSFHHNLPL